MPFLPTCPPILRLTRRALARVLPASLLCAALVTQSPLTTTYGGTASAMQVFFDLSVANATGVTIKSLDINLVDPVGTTGTVSLQWTLPAYGPWQLIPGPWSIPVVGTVTAAGAGQSSHVCFLPFGMTVPFGVHGVCVTCTGVSALTTSIAAPLTVGLGAAAVTLTPGDANTGVFLGPLARLFAVPWRFDGAIHFEYGAGPLTCPAHCADRVSGGVGCYLRPLSFYEDNTITGGLAAFAMGGTTTVINGIRLTPGGAFNPTGYNVDWFTNGAWQTPATPLINNLNAGPMADDSYSVPFAFPGPAFDYPDGFGGTLSTNSIQVSANGYARPVATVATFSNAYQTAKSLLDGAARYAPLLADIDPQVNGTGDVYCDFVAGKVYVTWKDVSMWSALSGAVSLNFQIEFDPVTDIVEYRYEVMSGLGFLPTLWTLNPCLVGWTQGGGAVDPGSMSIMTAAMAIGGFQRFNPERAALHLASTWPVLGEDLLLTTTNIPPCTTIVANVLGFAAVNGNNGFDLGFLGMPGCYQYITPDIVWVDLTLGATSSIANAHIPLNANFCGLPFYAQSVTLGPLGCVQNSLSALTSNYLFLTVGN